MVKTVVVTGATGQDGSYMIEYLLENTQHNILAATRRTSQFIDSNLKESLKNPRVRVVNFDLLDPFSIETLIKEERPDYFINFGAQTFVADSWKAPVLHMQTNAMGTLYILEAIRKHAPKCRSYFAGSSEIFGDISYTPQDEQHPLNPRSPYGVSKATGKLLSKVYRESYGIYSVQGTLFNHECLTANTPILIKDKNSGLIDIIPIQEAVPHRRDKYRDRGIQTSTTIPDFEVWDGGTWTEVLTRTATWNDDANDKKVKRVMCRGSFYEATHDHISFKEGEVETKTGELAIGDKLELKPYPELTERNILTAEEAELLGLLTAEGFVSEDGHARFTNCDQILLDRADYLWKKITTGYTSIYKGKSGYNPENVVYHLNLLGDADYCRKIRSELYTRDDRHKRIPQRILNASKDLIKAYLVGYNAGDGLKAGKGDKLFKCFTTSSPILASGLFYCVNKALGLRMISCPEVRGDSLYFHLNINAENSNKGKGFIKPLNEITKIQDLDYEGFVFDLETKSGTFSAGVGMGWVHNSPRRQEYFVTRKITKGVGRINHAINTGQAFKPIELGNVDAKRDWSHAKDFMDGVWKMLNQETPKDYVLSSNETHSVREFVQKAFDAANIPGVWHGNGLNEEYSIANDILEEHPVKSSVLVKINSQFYRPAEVDLLLGNSSLARKELGWTPKISFDSLVKEMVDYDIKNFKV